MLRHTKEIKTLFVLQIFTLSASIFFQRGIAKADTKEMASLCVEPVEEDEEEGERQGGCGREGGGAGGCHALGGGGDKNTRGFLVAICDIPANEQYIYIYIYIYM